MGSFGVIIVLLPTKIVEGDRIKSTLCSSAWKSIATNAVQAAKVAKKTKKTNARAFNLTRPPPFYILYNVLLFFGQ